MEAPFTSLDQIRIAKPCPADWNGMTGDDRVRHCGQCDRKVFNLSGMTRFEAQRLLLQSEGRVCVRFYRRADGKVMTRDCGNPIFLRRKIALGSATILATIAAVAVGSRSSGSLQNTRKPQVVLETGAPAIRVGERTAPASAERPSVEVGQLAVVKPAALDKRARQED